MKRVILIASAILISLSFSVMATGGKVVDIDTTTGRKVLEYTVGGSSKLGEARENEILERFGIKFNYEPIPDEAFNDKVQLLFATDEEPNLIRLRQPLISQFGMEGRLIPMSDYLDKVPNYMRHWKPDEWKIVRAFEDNADGNLYYLPVKQAFAGGQEWCWRKGAFDRMGLTFPVTTDELYNVAKKIKAEYPESTPIPSCWGTGFFLTGFELAHRTEPGWHFDPDTKEATYGPTTEKYRDVLKYLNRLYREKLTEQEFPTITGTQYGEKFAKGLTYIQYHWATRANWANQIMAEVDPDANWQWSDEWIIAYPGKEQLSHVSRPYTSKGETITAKTDKEHIERYLEYIDWLCTDEGIIWYEFGTEGDTFNYVNGKPVFADFIQTIKNPDGKSRGDYGLGESLLVESIEASSQEWAGDVSWAEAVWAIDHIPMIAWDISEDDEKDLADVETVINDVRDEYIIKFVMGKLDPSNDAHWNEFQNALKKAGLDESSAIRKKAFKTSVYY